MPELSLEDMESRMIPPAANPTYKRIEIEDFDSPSITSHGKTISRFSVMFDDNDDFDYSDLSLPIRNLIDTRQANDSLKIFGFKLLKCDDSSPLFKYWVGIWV